MSRSILSAPWVSPALSLVTWWFSLTAMLAAGAAALGVGAAGPAKSLPYLVAGILTGRTGEAATPRVRLAASAALALASWVGWTLFSAVGSSMSPSAALVLWASSTPVHVMLAAWGYFGMWLATPASALSAGGAED